ncbi:MAG: Rrf2 family transcriptional regulator [Clostridia bacterium]|nr:Rrf2 family transcriptional regulator [Clostridia bacterium]
MKISTRGRYAIRILLDIAMHQSSGYVAMKDIAQRQQISKKYGDQIGMQLSQAGLLSASRGRQGGYALNQEPKDITVYQVLRLMEGSLTPVQCLDTTPNRCERCKYCATLPLWTGLNQVMETYLRGVTLQSLLDSAPPQPEGEQPPILE